MSRPSGRRGLQAEGASGEGPREATIGLLLLDMDSDEPEAAARIFGPADADILLPVVLLHADGSVATSRGDTRTVSHAELANALGKLQKMIAAQCGPRSGMLEHKDLRLDPLTVQAEARGRRLDLTRREVELLQVLMENPQRLVSRHEIFEAIWGASSPFTANLLDVNMSRLRQKLERVLGRPAIKTVRGRGYQIM